MIKVNFKGEKFVAGTVKEFLDRGYLESAPEYLVFKSLQYIKAYPDGRVVEISKNEFDKIKAAARERIAARELLKK